MKTLSIQGSMASGKTTLVKALERQFPELTFIYENPLPLVQKRQQLGLNLQTKTDYLANQRLFIEAAIIEARQPRTSNVIYDRGPEDIVFYTLYYPQTQGFNWQIETELAAELTELQRYYSDSILYLTANQHTLQQRKTLDTARTRKTFTTMEQLYNCEKHWFSQLNTTFIETTNKNTIEVFNETVNYLEKQHFI